VKAGMVGSEEVLVMITQTQRKMETGTGWSKRPANRTSLHQSLCHNNFI